MRLFERIQQQWLAVFFLDPDDNPFLGGILCVVAEEIVKDGFGVEDLPLWTKNGDANTSGFGINRDDLDGLGGEDGGGFRLNDRNGQIVFAPEADDSRVRFRREADIEIIPVRFNASWTTRPSGILVSL